MRTVSGVGLWVLALALIPFIEPPANGATILAFVFVAVGAALLWPDNNGQYPHDHG